MATNRGLKPLTPIIFEHIMVMSVHGSSYAGLYDRLAPPPPPLPHANARILKAARHRRGELTWLQIFLAGIQTSIYPPPRPPSAPHYQNFQMDTDSHRAPLLFLFHSVLRLLSWSLRRENLGTSAVTRRFPSGGQELAVLNYVDYIVLLRYGIKGDGAIMISLTNRGHTLKQFCPHHFGATIFWL